MRRGAAKREAEEEADTADPVLRCDLLPHAMNQGKEERVLALLREWRRAAATCAAIQWRIFQETCRFDGHADVAADHRKAHARARRPLLELLTARYGLERPDAEAPKKRRFLPTPPGLVDPLADVKAGLGAARTQMVRRQVVGVLESFVSNRQNDFVDAVVGSSVDDVTRHMLMTVNVAKAWSDMDRPVRVKREVEGVVKTLVVPDEVRRVARSIWRQVLSRHRRPSMRSIGMVVDQREAKLQKARGGAFPLWLKLGTLGKPVLVPLRETERLKERVGDRKLTVQVNQDRVTKRLSFGVITDIAAACEPTKAEHAKKVATPELALDFGLATVFATSDGDLFGRGFIARLSALDETITEVARHRQRLGLKPNDSERYRKLVRRARGYVETEIRRVLNRIVAVKKPGHLRLERLDFRSPTLSRRMNRIVQNCGRGIVRDKLASLEQELGITSTECQAAYTSQTCSSCDYVDKRNRRDQALFECQWCGLKLHADVNAARNVGKRRSLPIDSGTGSTRRQILAGLVQRHRERWPRTRVYLPIGRTGTRRPADPRLDNPYFRAERAARSPASEATRTENRTVA